MSLIAFNGLEAESEEFAMEELKIYYSRMESP